MRCRPSVISALWMVAALVLLSVFIVTGSHAQTTPTIKQLSVAKPKRLLFVGNSYLYHGDSLHSHLARMVVAGGMHGARHIGFKSATISGAALFDHSIQSYLEPGKLRVREPFEVVILQGHSVAGLSSKRRAAFLRTVIEFSKAIKEAGGETALYMTHAYVPPHSRHRPDMIKDIAKLYIETGNKIGALVIPVGLAFEESYRQRPNLRLHKHFDGSHPSLLGTYLATATVYASLYGGSPVGNGYDYFGEIDKEKAAFLQRIAERTVNKFYGR